MRKLPILIGLAAVVLITVLSSVFIVDERQQALVLQFGQVVREIRGDRISTESDVAERAADVATTAEQDDNIELSKTGPGLYFKLPIIQDVVYYDDRILPLDTAALEVTPIDDRRLVVDAFARWRIEDPVQFRQAVQTEIAAQPRLERILNAALREVLGSVPSDSVLSEERSELMSRITEVARDNSRNLGINVIDVRIKRADLPEENLQATYRRMQAEREREAADERARGRERAQEIRARAEREAVELVSDAERRAQIIRGRADGERNRIYAEAFGKDEEFFAFYRSLTAYEKALTGDTSTMVMSPDGEFFEYLRDDRGPATGPSATLTAPAPDVPLDGATDAPAGELPEGDGTGSEGTQGDAGSDVGGDDEEASAAPAVTGGETASAQPAADTQ